MSFLGVAGRSSLGVLVVILVFAVLMYSGGVYYGHEIAKNDSLTLENETRWLTDNRTEAMENISNAPIHERAVYEAGGATAFITVIYEFLNQGMFWGYHATEAEFQRFHESWSWVVFITLVASVWISYRNARRLYRRRL